MLQLIYFILGIIVGAAAVGCRMMRSDRSQEEVDGPLQIQAREKGENKKKILVLFNSRDTVTNNDIEALLGVSDATATRYMDELEKEGAVRQVGRTGKHSHYERIKGES